MEMITDSSLSKAQIEEFTELLRQDYGYNPFDLKKAKKQLALKERYELTE